MFQLGIERISAYPGVFKGKRLGLLTSASAVDQNLRSTASILYDKHSLCALFAPEHGLYGAAGPGELLGGTTKDRETGVTVHNLYRKESKRFTAEMLAEVDAVVYDIQDLGLRFYTYISSLLYAMEDCARFDKELIVLDRPAPLGGLSVEGGLPEPGFESFVSCYPMPIRYGLTPGEFAAMANAEQRLGCQLTVIPMEGWERRQLFPALPFPFVMPSPSIAHFDNAMLYAGTCLFEGTNLSEGRGSADPFALIGAPYINALSLAREVRRMGLPGLMVTPAVFTPAASKHAGILCEGIRLYVSNPAEYAAVEAGLRILMLIWEMYPKEFAFLPPLEDETRHPMDLLSGNAAIRQGMAQDRILSRWREDCQAFLCRARPYWRY